MKNMIDLSGKIAAITGGASGIGLATAKQLIASGAKVVLIDRNEEALASLAEEMGDAVIPLTLDLLDAESCSQMMPKILELTGQLDIFHANAGIYIGGDLLDAETDAIDRMLNLNVNVVMKNVRDVLPHMIERGNCDIVVTGSVAGHFPVRWEPVYAASKWAIRCFVQTTRRQVCEHDVRVTSVSPGPVDSALLSDWPEENLKKARDSGAIINPDDIADAIMFILSRRREVSLRDIVILPSNFDM